MTEREKLHKIYLDIQIDISEKAAAGKQIDLDKALRPALDWH